VADRPPGLLETLLAAGVTGVPPVCFASKSI